MIEYAYSSKLLACLFIFIVVLSLTLKHIEETQRLRKLGVIEK